MKADLLLKLAEHLETGVLGHKKFDFNVVNGDEDGLQLRHNGCGYCGCAIGELPYALPELFEWKNGWPILKNGWDSVDICNVGGILDIYEEEAEHLFQARMQRTDEYGGFVLDEYATKEQVAANIRAFVAKKREGL